ncbi:hypothetical protein P3S68_022748 [Capsicum galapagoense]
MIQYNGKNPLHFSCLECALQQQYREKDFKKYTELSSHLLVAEQNNNLLMKNHENRPTGSAPFPKVNDVHAHYARRGKGRGSGRGRGRGRDDQERNLVQKHYSRDRRAHKHLIDLYQASLKKKERNPEANFLSENNVDNTCLDVADFYEYPKGKIDHLIGDGSVNMEE